MNTNFEFRKPEFKNFSNINFGGESRRALKTSAIAFLIMLILSAIVATIRGINLGGIVRVNIFSVLLGIHLVDMKIRGSMMFSATTVNIGIILILVVPIIILAISNFFIYRRRFDSMRDCIYESIKIAFIYGMLLALASIFSKIRLSTGMDSMFGFGFNNKIVIGYKMISSFTNGFIIAFLTSIILNWKREYHGESYITDIVSDVFKIFVKLSLLIIVITTIVVFTKSYTLSDFGLSEYSKGGTVVAYIAQISSYLLAISSGGTVNVGDNTNAISLFSVFNKSVFTDTRLLILIVFSIFALLMIYVGVNIYSNYRFENKRTVIHFSAIYGFLVGLVAKFSSIALSTTSSQILPSVEIIVRVNPLAMFVVAFMFSMLFIEMGYRLAPSLDKYFE